MDKPEPIQQTEPMLFWVDRLSNIRIAELMDSARKRLLSEYPNGGFAGCIAGLDRTHFGDFSFDNDGYEFEGFLPYERDDEPEVRAWMQKHGVERQKEQRAVRNPFTGEMVKTKRLLFSRVIDAHNLESLLREYIVSFKGISEDEMVILTEDANTDSWPYGYGT
ncbi:MAG: hypothetical protein AAF328_00205 [Planctomycetota bacterium]